VRVALLCPYSLDVAGGVGTHVLGLADWLAGEGQDPVVVAPGTREPSVPSVLLGGAVRLPFNGSTARLALGRGQVRAARRAVETADVVHVHEPLTPGVAFGVARTARRLVVTHHASFAPGPLVPLLRARAALLAPDRVPLAVSRAAADTAAAATGTRPPVVPNGVVLQPPPTPRTGRPVVVFVGRLDEPRKGYALFARLAQQGLDADFVAVGRGGTGAEGVVEFGELADAARDALLARASVLVAPNRFGESFGLVLVEALGAGCAVVASDLPAFRDVVDDPAVATFFPPDDLAAATAALLARLADPADVHRARSVAERYGWDRVGPRVLAAYQEAGGGPTTMA